MTGNGGPSELLQAGFTQKTFLALLEQQPEVDAVRDYIQTSAASVVPFVINATHDALSYPMDRLSNGHALLELSAAGAGADNNQSFGAAADALRRSIDLNRRNPEGGLWYFVYPEWSYLDGMYSLAPFYTLYTKTKTCEAESMDTGTTNTTALDDMYFQIDLLWRHNRREETGLLVHGYDASRAAVWADPHSGASPYVWDRALGWYVMALVDTLEILRAPSTSATREGSEYEGPLLEKFQSLAKAVIAAADPQTGAWWQIMDQPGREGNYIESSGSAMFAYALLKGARLGYLGSVASDAVRAGTRAHNYLTKTFVVHEKDDILGYNGTVSVCSLNSTATFEVSYLHPLFGFQLLQDQFCGMFANALMRACQYYTHQPIEYNNVLGSNAYILASLEAERFQQ